MDFAALQHSIFLQALGSTILNSLWQALIIWLLYETISVSYKNASAKFRNNLSTILLFFSFIWFVAGLVYKIVNQQNPGSIIPATINIADVSKSYPGSFLDSFLAYAVTSLPYLSVAYIFLLFFLMAKLFSAYRYVYIISNKRLLASPLQLQDFAKKVSGQMKITRKISVWISHHIDVPATIGFIKPVILIPFASLNNLSGDQLEAIILHELSHIKRNDYLINILIAVIETILFFNPFIVLLSKAIKKERENCCDDFVLNYQYDPHSYATALLRLEQSRVSNLKLAIGAVSGKQQLLSRIKRITNGQVASTQFNYGQKLLALLLVTGIICSVAWLSPGEKKTVSKKFLLKEIKVKTLSKTDFSPRTINLADDQKENLQARFLKHISPRKKFVPFKEDAIPGFSIEENENFNNNENKAGRYLEAAPLALNLKEPKYFFDETKLKFPESIDIKNFPFQNFDFNIDLSNVDMGKLNENLKLAYKEINNINWDKVQDHIRESFSGMKADNFLSKEQSEILVEKASELSELKRLDQQKFNVNILLEKMNKEVKRRDSLDANIQRKYQRMQRQYSVNRSMNNNSYFIYSPRKSSVNENSEDNTATVWVNGSNSPTPLDARSVKISIKHLPRCIDSAHPKKLMQFSFATTNTEKSEHENVIKVEVTDLP
ncbi:MAG TPA: M56 family metallopeptidase [Ginsengibacter sp.]|nr:M56 family metallopeptidase [Ginsengibacter sp.]